MDKNNINQFKEIRQIFGKSLSLNKSKKAGERIHLDDLESKKPSGYGIPAQYFEQVVGKTLNKKLKRWSFINWEDID